MEVSKLEAGVIKLTHLVSVASSCSASPLTRRTKLLRYVQYPVPYGQVG
jgi:hypothetical protein